MTRPQTFACIIFIVSSLAGCKPEYMQSAAEIKSATTQALQQRNYADAVQQAKRLTEKSPEDPQAHYLLAQAHAQAGDRSAALLALEQAIKNGLKDNVDISNNARLEPLRDMSAYADLMSKSFPDKTPPPPAASVSITGATKAEVGSVSIQESPDGRQVIRAGDVVIDTSAAK